MLPRRLPADIRMQLELSQHAQHWMALHDADNGTLPAHRAAGGAAKVQRRQRRRGRGGGRGWRRDYEEDEDEEEEEVEGQEESEGDGSDDGHSDDWEAVEDTHRTRSHKHRHGQGQGQGQDQGQGQSPKSVHRHTCHYPHEYCTSRCCSAPLAPASLQVLAAALDEHQQQQQQQQPVALNEPPSLPGEGGCWGAGVRGGSRDSGGGGLGGGPPCVPEGPPLPVPWACVVGQVGSRCARS